VILWQEKRATAQILPSAVAELVEATAHPQNPFFRTSENPSRNFAKKSYLCTNNDIPQFGKKRLKTN